MLAVDRRDRLRPAPCIPQGHFQTARVVLHRGSRSERSRSRVRVAIGPFQRGLPPGIVPEKSGQKDGEEKDAACRNAAVRWEPVIARGARVVYDFDGDAVPMDPDDGESTSPPFRYFEDDDRSNRTMLLQFAKECAGNADATSQPQAFDPYPSLPRRGSEK